MSDLKERCEKYVQALLNGDEYESSVGDGLCSGERQHGPLDAEDVFAYTAAEYGGEDVFVYPAFGPESMTFTDGSEYHGDNIMNFWIERPGEWWYYGYEPAPWNERWTWLRYGPYPKDSKHGKIVGGHVEHQEYPRYTPDGDEVDA